MPFFENAHDFVINGSTFTQTAYPDPWAPSVHQGISNLGSRTVMSPEILRRVVSEEPPSPDDKLQANEVHYGLRDYILAFLVDTVPRQIYLHCLLRLPALYFSRVERIFKDTDISLEEIVNITLRGAAEDRENPRKDPRRDLANLQSGSELTDPSLLPPSYRNLTNHWESFINSLLEEWRTLNFVSALLVPGILTIFQIPGAWNDPITRYLAYWALLSALFSLLYGCSFIIQFSRMHPTYKAIGFTQDAKETRTIFWNTSVMLAVPATWLAWSICAFIACVIWSMWQPHPDLPNDSFTTGSHSTELGFRIFISVVLGIGVVYFIRILITFQRYGATMDRAWDKQLNDYIADRNLPRGPAGSNLGPNDLHHSPVLS